MGTEDCRTAARERQTRSPPGYHQVAVSVHPAAGGGLCVVRGERNQLQKSLRAGTGAGSAPLVGKSASQPPRRSAQSHAPDARQPPHHSHQHSLVSRTRLTQPRACRAVNSTKMPRAPSFRLVLGERVGQHKPSPVDLFCSLFTVRCSHPSPLRAACRSAAANISGNRFCRYANERANCLHTIAPAIRPSTPYGNSNSTASLTSVPSCPSRISFSIPWRCWNTVNGPRTCASQKWLFHSNSVMHASQLTRRGTHGIG